jgi:hypothetical protein
MLDAVPKLDLTDEHADVTAVVRRTVAEVKFPIALTSNYRPVRSQRCKGVS